MDSGALTRQKMPAPLRRRVLVHTIPLVVALLTIGVIYSILSAPFAFGPPGLVLGLIVSLMLGLIAAIYIGHFHITRLISLVLLGVVTLAEAASTSALIAGLLGEPTRLSEVPHATALILMRDAALIWVVNILTFTFWYWEIDGGGPSRRLHMGYHSSDFIFPQLTLERPTGQPWIPHFFDYLFLAFNTSTAFSPTDTQVLSIRAKILMMVQSLLSLTVLAIIIARAVNTL